MKKSIWYYEGYSFSYGMIQAYLIVYILATISWFINHESHTWEYFLQILIGYIANMITTLKIQSYITEFDIKSASY